MEKGSSKRVVYAALAGNLLIAVTKFVASVLTGSAAMLSEAIHSLVDTGNQVLLLYGMRAARRPASPQYPFGHGREIYFWSFVVAILIFSLGAGLSGYEGIRALLHPEPSESALANYIVLGLALIFEGFSWSFAFHDLRERRPAGMSYLTAVRRSKNPTMFVVLLEDSAAILGLLIALIGVTLTNLLGDPLYDALAAVFIGVVLGIVAIFLAIECKGLLIGESASRRIVDGIGQIVREDRRVGAVTDVLTMHLGPDDILLNLNVVFRDDLTAEEIEDTVCALERRIQQNFPDVRRIFIEAAAFRRAVTQPG